MARSRSPGPPSGRRGCSRFGSHCGRCIARRRTRFAGRRARRPSADASVKIGSQAASTRRGFLSCRCFRRLLCIDWFCVDWFCFDWVPLSIFLREGHLLFITTSATLTVAGGASQRAPCTHGRRKGRIPSSASQERDRGCGHIPRRFYLALDGASKAVRCSGRRRAACGFRRGRDRLQGRLTRRLGLRLCHFAGSGGATARDPARFASSRSCRSFAKSPATAAADRPVR